MTDHGALGLGDPYLPASGNGGYRVEHYALELGYKVASNRLDGVTTITAVTTQQLDRFGLDLVGFTVSRVTVDGTRARFTRPARKIVVTPAAPLKAGTRFAVEVRYQGSPKPARSKWGDVGWEELSNGVLVAGQPSGAPTWFPCNDHPSNKASYSIRVDAENPYTVVGNGKLVSRTPGASSTTWHYEQEQPMASYLAALQIGEYATERSRSGPVPHSLFYPPALRSAVRTDFAPLSRMLKLFERMFGPYPFDDYRVVITEDELEIPLEAQGMASYGSNHVDGEHGYDRLIAHELAHQWFGNSVTAAEWKHIWLHEGFACYAEWLWSEERRGPTAAELAAGHRAALAALPQDIVVADPGAALMFDDRVYKRGALTLHALRQTIGDAAFFATLRDWTDGHRYGNATTDEFVATAQSHSSVPLGGLFGAWLTSKALPELPD